MQWGLIKMGLLEKATRYRESERKESEAKECLSKMVEYGNKIADLYEETKERQRTREENNLQKIYEKAFMYYSRKGPHGEEMGKKFLNMYKVGVK
jgi:hypothetical protein